MWFFEQISAFNEKEESVTREKSFILRSQSLKIPDSSPRLSVLSWIYSSRLPKTPTKIGSSQTCRRYLGTMAQHKSCSWSRCKYFNCLFYRNQRLFGHRNSLSDYSGIRRKYWKCSPSVFGPESLLVTHRAEIIGAPYSR